MQLTAHFTVELMVKEIGALLSISKGRKLIKDQSDHHERIDRIKNRRPNTSVTLDNALPKTLENRIVINSKTEFARKHDFHTTEQQNR